MSAYPYKGRRKYLTRAQAWDRIKRGDLPERFENYAAFRSDGAKVKLHNMRLLVAEELVNDAKPNIGAPWTPIVKGTA